jgi:aryl-alcohol dehydrogenase-like predicted oxidoreductase
MVFTDMSIKLPTRQLGVNGPQVTALGFGVMGLSFAFYGKPLPEEEQLKFLDRAFEMGQVNWDTADVYGDSEIVIGNWFRRTGKRDQVLKTPNPREQIDSRLTNILLNRLFRQ